MNPLLLCDFYKTSHKDQYPVGTEYVYSNLTPRKSRLDNTEYSVFFGLQYFIKEYLIDRFNNDFFHRSKSIVIDEYKRIMDESIGKDSVNIDHIAELHDLGYLPIRIKALPEGTRCPIKVPMLTIINTNPRFFWLTNKLETILSCSLWQACTSATIADKYRQNFDWFYEKTGINKSFANFAGHDFSMRGMSSLESACLSGAGHLLSFLGTDTIPAIKFIEKYYGGQGLIGCSVPASEHSVTSCGGDSYNEQIAFIKRMITEVYPTGILSLVADTWDFYWFISEGMKILKPEIMARNGKLVARPDSGDPVKIITGDDDAPIGSLERKGSYEILAEIFGTTLTSTGYKQLDSHVGLIYGDSITLDRQVQICSRLIAKGFAPDVILGIGSFSYQYNTRDTLGFAVKATWAQINGQPKDIFKSPKTDKGGEKKSAKGLLMVDENLVLHDQCTWEQEGKGLLKPIFENGNLLLDEKFDILRKRLHPTWTI